MRRFWIRLGTIVVAPIAALTVGAIAVLACTSLATITPNTPSGSAGSNVTVTGHAFDPAGSPVSLLWNSAQGPKLAVVPPDANGNVSASVTIPADAATGYYVIIASQLDKDGQPAFGTPARASFQVGTPTGSVSHGGSGVPGSANTAPVSAAPVAASSSGTDGTLIALLIVGAVGGVLFAGGIAFFVHELRRREVAAPARTER